MANKKRKKERIGAKLAKCAFQVAIENTEEVKNGFCVGKHAIKSIDRSKVVAAKKINCKVALILIVKLKHYILMNLVGTMLYRMMTRFIFFEVHPAETSKVNKVVNKVKWLKCWLKTHAPEINKLPKAEHPYTWVQSGRYAILPTAREKMKLSISGITTANILSLK